MYLGVTGVAAPKAASSRTARYSSTARPAGLRRQAGRAVHGGPVPAGVGADDAGVHGEAFAADQALGHAAAHHALEQLAQQVTVAETAVPVLGEGGMVRHVAVETETAEPAIRQVEVNLLAQPTLRADAETVAHQQHPDHQFGVDGRPANRAVERRQVRPHAVQIDEAINGAEQMVLGNVPLQRELVEQLGLIDPPLSHHARVLPASAGVNQAGLIASTALFQQHPPISELGKVRSPARSGPSVV